MKRTFILSVTIILSSFLVLSSCKSSRVWETKDSNDRTVRTPPPPPPSRQYSPASYRNNPAGLIISPRPGFTMNQNASGHYYHRSQQGLLYWKGYDNRFYLDKSYLNRVNYSKWEYKDWKRYKKDAAKKSRY